METPATVLNEIFVNKLASAEGKEKAAEVGGLFIRDRLREECFQEQIVPSQKVTRADCQRSPRHDTLVKIVDIEPKSRAMSLTFRGQPQARFLTGDKAEVAFSTISSELMQKTEQELLAWEMPFTKIVEENSVKDMGEIRDREMIIYTDAACQALQIEANGGVATALNWSNLNLGAVTEFSIVKGELARTAGVNNATVRPLQRPDLAKLFKLLDGNRLKSDVFLITVVDWDDLLTWTVEDFGDRLQSETTVDGYKYNLLLGRRYVRTIKTDILRPGNVYVFTAPDFLGKSYILNNTRFYIDKIANTIMFQAWMDLAFSLINIAAVRKLELYSSDASSVDADALRYRVIPMEEEALGAVNNRVSQGLKFPQITSF